ncbi:MAG: serine/threonine protein kinase, partial [Actinomycetia bacterium]|nr:serine/threonine protein kinase [Actinomycetes bacterium]
QRPGRTRTVVIVLMAAIVVAASLIAGALILKSKTSGLGPNTSYTTPAAQQNSLDGYTTGTGPGFSISFPTGWSRSENEQGVYWTAPAAKTLLQVGQTPWKVATAAEQATQFDSEVTRNTALFPHYVRLNLATPLYRGATAGEVEFRYTDNQGRSCHAVDRFFKVNGKPYAIYFRSLEQDWASFQTYRDQFYSSFKAA